MNQTIQLSSSISSPSSSLSSPLSSLPNSKQSSTIRPPPSSLSPPVVNCQPLRTPSTIKAVNTIQGSKSKPRNKLKILNVNCQSIKNKHASFSNLIDRIKPDVIIGTESWLDPSIRDNEYFPPNFTVYRKDRNLHGGGVFIAVRKEFVSSTVSDLDEKCEIIWSKLETVGCKKKIYMCSYYRPNVKDEESLENFKKSIGKLNDIGNGNVIIGGDFNFPGWDWKNKRLKSNTPYSQLHHDFVDALDDCALTQLVEDPTCHNNTLDLIITNNPSLVTQTEVVPGISDHEAVCIEIDISPIKNKQKTRNIPLYKRANWDALRKDIEITAKDLENNMSLNIEELWQKFKHALESGVQAHIPHKQCKSKNSQPWINNKIRTMIRQRDRYYKKYRKFNDLKYKESYKNMKHQVQKEIRSQYWIYVEGLFSPDESGNCSKSMKRFWSYIKHRKTDPNGTPALNVGNKLITSAVDRATALNEQFQSVFSKKQILSLKNLVENQIRDQNKFVNENQPVIEDINITQEGVTKLLKGLDPTKACGPDNIQSRVLKELADTISPCLRIIYQKSLNTCEVPKDWKMANITPIFKKGKREFVENYRPVSLTCISSKILEHIVVSHVMKYSDTHDILYDLQHGFRYKRSCETQLISFIEDVSKSLEKGQQTDVLIMDFSKAFDKVDHNTLCHKLRQYGITGKINRWIENFLKNRSQSVVIDGEASHSVPVDSGVPQGSVIGPTLFLFYINDLAENLMSKVRLFADDTMVYLVIKSPQDAETLQSDLDKLTLWEKKNSMEFHPQKCNVITVSRKHNPIIYNYTLHGHTLGRVQSSKYLGVTITADLRWDEHIAAITSKANQTLGFLRRNLNIKSVRIKEKAYQSLVRPIVEYASTVWDPHTKTLVHNIEKVQRRAARYVTGNYSQQSSVSDMIKGLGWKSLEERRKNARLKMMYKIKNNMVALTNPNLIKPTRVTRSTHENSYLEISTTKNYRKFSFYPRTISDWNKLPQEISCAPSLDSFFRLLSLFNE